MKAVFSPRLAKPAGPFSPAIDTGGFIYVSGQIGQRPSDGAIAGGGVEQETEQVFANLEAILEAAGKTFGDVVRAGVHLTDMKDFAVMNNIYSKYFKQPYPARTTIAVLALPLNAKVENRTCREGLSESMSPLPVPRDMAPSGHSERVRLLQRDRKQPHKPSSQRAGAESTSPAYPPARSTLDAVSAKVRVLDLSFDRGYEPDLAEFGDLLSQQTKLVSLASPQNPSDLAIPAKTLRDIVAIMEERCPAAHLVVDETYREAAYGDDPVASSAVRPQHSRDRFSGLRGYIVREFAGQRDVFLDDVLAWIAGRVRYREDVAEGIERAPEAFIGILEGRNVGKLLLRVTLS